MTIDEMTTGQDAARKLRDRVELESIAGVEQMGVHLADLRVRATAITDGRLQGIALKLVWDMEFATGGGWPDGPPTKDSKVTPPEQHSFRSATATVEYLIDLHKQLERLRGDLKKAKKAMQAVIDDNDSAMFVQDHTVEDVRVVLSEMENQP